MHTVTTNNPEAHCMHRPNTIFMKAEALFLTLLRTKRFLVSSSVHAPMALLKPKEMGKNDFQILLHKRNSANITSQDTTASTLQKSTFTNRILFTSIETHKTLIISSEIAFKISFQSTLALNWL